MIALPFQRVKYTWPPNPLVHKNFESPFFVFCFSSKTHYLITLIMTYIFLIIYLFFGLIKLSLLQLLHCMLKPLFFTSIGYDQLISLQTSMNALQVPTTAVWTTATSTNTKYRSIALVVLDIQICRHKIRHTSGLPEILDTGLTGATASFAHLPQPLFPFSPVTHYHDHGTFCRLHFRHR